VEEIPKAKTGRPFGSYSIDGAKLRSLNAGEHLVFEIPDAAGRTRLSSLAGSIGFRTGRKFSIRTDKANNELRIYRTA
jgi:hypothetical protein